jgi:uncharacterized membrane protein YkvA (DUF1232 family)
MSDLDNRCLDAFPEWLRSLADDVGRLAALLDDTTLGEPVRRHAASAVNYLFKSLDLIPDGIEDLGFVDDAFVLRVAASLAVAADAGARDADGSGTLERLSSEAALIREFLGDDYERLERYVLGLGHAVARGRSVDDILAKEDVRSELLGEIKGWIGSYDAPSFSRDAKNLIKLRSFLKTKLPA